MILFLWVALLCGILRRSACGKLRRPSVVVFCCEPAFAVQSEGRTVCCVCVMLSLYCSAAADAARRSAQTVQFHLLDSLTKTLAPIVPHFAEETHQYHPLNLCQFAVLCYS